MTTQCQPWRLEPVGACRAISRASSTVARSTGLSKSRRLRTLRVVVRTSSADRFSFMPVSMAGDNGAMSDRVTISIDDRGIADVRLNRPDKRNALDGAMFAGLRDAGEQLKAEPERARRRAVGRGRVVLRRARLLARSSRWPAASARGRRRPTATPARPTPGGITHLGQQAAWVWQELPVPVIAAVHGHALGGGIQIALGADIRIVHPDTQLSVREVHWGLVPDMTGTLFLSRLVGARRGQGADVHGPHLLRDRGRRAGPGHPRVARRRARTPWRSAAEIAGRSPEAVRGAKALFNRLANADAAEQFAEERRVIGSLIGTPNQIETVTANFEKRAPEYVDPT